MSAPLIRALPAHLQEHAAWICAGPDEPGTAVDHAAAIRATIGALRRRNARLELLDLEHALQDDPTNPRLRDRVALIQAHLRDVDRGYGGAPMDRAWLERERNPPPRRPRRTP